NVLDLSLIYARRVEGHRISIDMTLTAPACGRGEVLCAELAQRLKQVPNVEAVDVNLVFDPPWNRNMLSEVAKLELGMFCLPATPTCRHIDDSLDKIRIVSILP